MYYPLYMIYDLNKEQTVTKWHKVVPSSCRCLNEEMANRKHAQKIRNNETEEVKLNMTYKRQNNTQDRN